MARLSMHACADRRGVIEILDHVPDGLIEIIAGSERFLRERICATARHGYDGSLLVPGIPEAESDDDALDALIAFRDWVRSQPRRRRKASVKA